MRKFFTGLLLLSTLLSTVWAQKDWQPLFEKYTPKLVIISYYEQLLSTEEITDREKVKRYLSGIVVDKNGLIMTSAQIFPANIEFSGTSLLMTSAAAPTDIKVKFNDGAEYSANFVGKDDDLGIAFVRLKDSMATEPVHFKKIKSLKIGQKIYLLSHLPESYDFTEIMTERTIVAHTLIGKKSFYFEKNFPSLTHFGLVLTKAGRAIGYFASPQSAASPIRHPFSPAPSSQLLQVILANKFTDLIQHPPLFKRKQTKRKKWLGIYMQPFNRDLARYFGQPALTGVLISMVIKNSPAEAASLLPGDVITRVNGQPIKAEKESDLETLRQLIRNQPTDTIRMEIFRKNHFILKKINLRSSPISHLMAEEVANPDLGFSVKELTQDVILSQNLREDFKGVWVSRVERAGWADLAGLQLGDLIVSINDVKINSLQDVKNIFKTIENKKPPYVKLFIQRKENTYFLFIKTNYTNKQGDQ